MVLTPRTTLCQLRDHHLGIVISGSKVMDPGQNVGTRSWRDRLHEVIYESNTLAGKVFDVSLLFLILLSTLIVILDSVPKWHTRYGEVFYTLEWTFTVIFTLEYVLRLISIRQPLRYVFSFL